MKEKKLSSTKMFNQICAVTFTRHAGLSSEEFLKEIGKDIKDERTAVRQAKFALMAGCIRELACANAKIELLNAHMQTLKGE